MKTYYKIFLLIFIVSCNYQEDKVKQKKSYDYLYQKEITADDVLFFDNYFLPFEWNNKKVIDSMENSYFSFYLYGFKEKKLYNKEVNFIRLVWLRSFNYPIIIRLNLKHDSTIATIKSNIGSGDYDSFGASMVMKRYLPSSYWHTIVNQLNEGFWKMTSMENYYGGSDGADILIEARINGRYHLVNRWSPNMIVKGRDSTELLSYFNICKNIIRLVDLNDEGRLYGRFLNRKELEIHRFGYNKNLW